MRHLLATAFSAIGIAAMAQETPAPLHIDFVADSKTCVSETLVFTASGASIPGSAAKYIWDFDNGQTRETDTPTIEYAYPEGGAYMPRLTVIPQEGAPATATTRITIGMPPSFAQYSSSMAPGHNGICLGETVAIKMPISSQPVEYRYRNACYEKSEQSIYNGYWTGSVDFKCFGQATVSDPGVVEHISIKAGATIEEDMQLTLRLPNGSELVIKEYGKKCPEGSPVESKIKYMKEFKIGLAPFHSQMEGCPLNGKWELYATSRGLNNEAYISGFEIKVADKILDSHAWKYTQEYDLRRAVWSGKGISATSMGESKATPPQYGNTRYSFVISDNLGCLHDTTIFIAVEEPSFAGSDSTTFIGDEINFRDNTSWAAETTWIFGDKTPLEYSGNAPHAYYEKGKYTVIMQAKSANGCVDIDTQFVNIVPRPLEVKEVNVFTPNGDGTNDVFTFFQEKESFLKSGGLTKMPANIRSIKGKIYNVYGQTIYKWDEVEASVFGWDGTWDNKGNRPCPPGTYFYDIIVYGKDGNSLKRTGSILLYRSK